MMSSRVTPGKRKSKARTKTTESEDSTVASEGAKRLKLDETKTVIPSSPATQMDAFLQSLSSPNRPPPSVPPPSVPGVPPPPANRPETKAGGDFAQKLQNIRGGDLNGSKEQLMSEMSVPSVGKQQPPSVKDMGGKSAANYSGKNSDLSTMEASSSDAASSVAATSTTHCSGNGLGGKPALVSSPSQQQLPNSSVVKRAVRQEMDMTSSFTPSRHNSVSSVANTPAEVKQEAAVKTESASPAPHMSPALKRASSAGVPIKIDVKFPKKEFSPENLLDALSPVLDMLYDQFPDCIPFRQPMDPILLQIPDYFDIIKKPIDLSTISKRLEEGFYKTPWEFCEDIWLMFDNCWTYNKKNTRVYKMGMKLSEVFDVHIDEAMVKLGYCCGRRYGFSPQVLYCYSRNVCPISWDTTYWSYQNRYVFCTKCFSEIQGDTVTVGEDLNSSSQIEKSLFIEMKNNSIEKEPMVSCVHCGRRMHRICVLYFEPLWPEGYHCRTCAKKLGIPKKENKFSAKRLAPTRLGTFLEDRVNNFLHQANVTTGEITIRLVSNTEKTLETRSGMNNRFGSDFPAQFPFKAKVMFVFQECDGVDLCIFGMHVQEYGSECPSPNSRRVYISYLDSVHYFQPKQYRTLVYHEILIGYLEHVKIQGYETVHIWACPPDEDDDYIYHCHPPEQKYPKPRRLQEWCRKIIERAKAEKVVYDWKDMHQQSIDDELTSVTELPYFEGDFWPNVIEEKIKELDQEERAQASEEGRGSKEAMSKTVTSKESEMFSKRAATSAKSCYLSQRIFHIVKKHKEAFFVIYLQTPNNEVLPSTVDPDPVMVCDLMEGRDSFLTMACERHLEFSSLRRTKYSTMVMLYELHNQGSAGFVYKCNACHMHVETRYHCSECEDFDLCVTCYREKGHEHKMEMLGLGLEFEGDSEPQQPQNPHEARKQSIQKCIQSLVHACQCRDMSCKLQSCIKMKRVIRHTRDCRLRNNGNCSICKQFVALCLYHARNCKEACCSVPLCRNIKQKLEKQHREQQIHQDHLIMRRMVKMRAYSGASSPFAHVAASPTPNTPHRAQLKSPSASPHPSDTPASPKPQQQMQGDLMTKQDQLLKLAETL
ncbi:CREB-binding protein-like isoform X2 [Dysidea avara]|uniref:CREB-binding protein-like isoform X2 n=1 Tax=Dysidea avara TaxID=196820 RepID=UPI003331C635